MKTHSSHCLIVKSKYAISAALGPQIPLPEEGAVVPPREIPTTSPQVEALVPIPESSDAPRHRMFNSKCLLTFHFDSQQMYDIKKMLLAIYL